MEGKKERNSSSGFWTNERHMQYLSSMEASFVRTMLENDGRVLRLDRYLPDSSDSTLDLPKERRQPHYAPAYISKQRGRIDKKTRRLSSQPYTSSQDQAVPQLEDGTSGKNARDADVPVALAHAHGN